MTTPAKLASALTALNTELLYMNEASYFARDAIAAAAKRRSVAAVFQLENTNELASSLAETWAVAGTDYFRGYVDNMAACTTADLHMFVARYLTKKPFVIAALVPADRASETSTLLSQYLSMSAQ